MISSVWGEGMKSCATACLDVLGPCCFGVRHYSPFQIAIHNGEENLEEQVDRVDQHGQQEEPCFARHHLVGGSRKSAVVECDSCFCNSHCCVLRARCSVESRRKGLVRSGSIASFRLWRTVRHSTPKNPDLRIRRACSWSVHGNPELGNKGVREFRTTWATGTSGLETGCKKEDKVRWFGTLGGGSGGRGGQELR